MDDPVQQLPQRTAIAGHMHEDFHVIADGGPIIFETCVMQGQAVDSTHYGYDLCLLDCKANMIHMVRIGGGKDRGIPILKNVSNIPSSNIVKDGLVFHLDGFDRGKAENVWRDTISGGRYTLFNTEGLGNGVRFKETKDAYAVSDAAGFPLNNHTIEAVYRRNTDNGAILYMGSTPVGLPRNANVAWNDRDKLIIHKTGSTAGENSRKF